VNEIARLRGSAAGTVRAQLARVYAKANVESHSGLIALFLDELLSLPGHLPAAGRP
jgi:DNA-binding CsgD family transcriptional regulator